MRILLINTAATEGSVTLADKALAEPVIATAVLPGRTSSEQLIPVIRRLLEHNAWKLSDLAAIAVVHGPGSFTGVRVGVSAAKGLSEAGGVPLIAISRLALLAASVDGGGGSAHAVLDAGRGEFYYGDYVGHRCVREALLSKREVVAATQGSIAVVCEERVREALAELELQLVDEPSAAAALPFAVDRIERQDFDDVATFDANYLRRTDAEIFAKPAIGVGG
jgi:tRNA threonylcarbamoyladenosine biosynthesis protein TsaB